MDKVYFSVDVVFEDVNDDIMIMLGGFGLCGNFENLILVFYCKVVKNFIVILNNCGIIENGLGVLF